MTKEELGKEAVNETEELKEYQIAPKNEYKHYSNNAELQTAYEWGCKDSAEPREKRITELEAQIEKMKNCKNCANYMISDKCPAFFRTGWCKNWEMAKGVNND